MHWLANPLSLSLCIIKLVVTGVQKVQSGITRYSRKVRKYSGPDYRNKNIETKHVFICSPPFFGLLFLVFGVF